MVGMLWAALAAASKGEAEEWLAGEVRLKGKSKISQPFFNLNAFYRFIPLFQARVRRDLFSPHSKARLLFSLEGQQGCKAIT